MEIPPSELTRSAELFLTSGKLLVSDQTGLAKACDDRIRQESQRSLRSAMTLAQRFVRSARPLGGVMELTAQRALARTTHMSAKHAAAEQAYLRARLLCGRDALTKARIDRALIDVYMYLGRFSESRRRARLALVVFRKLELPAEIAMTNVNLANVMHRQDRHRDAERLYAEAADYFLSIGDELAVARCSYNRANTLVQLFDIETAELLYRSSMEIYTRHGHALDATDARYGLAWLRMLTGRMHVALIELAECERAFRQFGQPKGAALCILDLAEVYLNLRLFSDAAEAAQSAEKEFVKLGHRYESSKAAFFRARAAFMLGELQTCRLALSRAEQGFTKDQNQGFLGAVHLLKSELAADEKTQGRELRTAQRFFRRAQLTLWEAVCDLYSTSDRALSRGAFNRLARNHAVHQVPYLFAWWQTLVGDAEQSRGRIETARQHWKLAADRLDAIRAELPPVELRSKFGSQEITPHVRLVRTLLGENLREAAVWSERYKTAGVWTPVKPGFPSDSQRERAEESLADLAERVAAVSRRLGGLSGERASYGMEAHKSISALQRRARLELAEVEKGVSSQLDPVEQILNEIDSASHRLPVVQFHVSGDDLVCFVHEKGETRLHRYEDGRWLVEKLMRQWRFLLESEILSMSHLTAGSIDSERRFFRRAAEFLWAPLEMSRNHRQVLIVPEGDLANFPWQALEVAGDPLLMRHHFVVTPSLRHCNHAVMRRTDSHQIFLFGGESSDLPEVQRELRSLERVAGKEVSAFLPARRGDWPSSGEARLWHFAGHAHMRAENPFYSYLALSDGPLFAADLRLKNVTVGLVTLAACRSGQQVAVPGEESDGLVRSMLEMGARNVLAGYWPVSDRSTASWMGTFYEGYFGGKSISASFRSASVRVREEFPSAYHWAAFAVHGADEPV